MKLELVLAIAAIVIALINRPIEIMWDKLIEHKKTVGRILVITFNVLVGFGLPICGILYTYFRVEFGKQFVFFLSTFFFLLLLAILRTYTKDLYEKVHHLERYGLRQINKLRTLD